MFQHYSSNPAVHQLVVETQGFEPSGPWEAFDGRRPPHTRQDKRPTWGEIHQLSRADAEHGVHARLHEQGQMGIGVSTMLEKGPRVMVEKSPPLG